LFACEKPVFRIFVISTAVLACATPPLDNYPQILCATLWITMFTTQKSRTTAGFADPALQLTSLGTFLAGGF
jgi:hypothetical protein